MKILRLFLILGFSCPLLFVFAEGRAVSRPTPVSPVPGFKDFKSACDEGSKDLKERRFEQAIADYAAAEKLTTTPKRKSQAANSQGWVFLKARKWKEAEEAFDRASAFDPQNKLALSNSGYASHKLYQYGFGGVEMLKAAVQRLEACNAIDTSYKPELLETVKGDLSREESYAQTTPGPEVPLKSMGYKTLITLGDKAQSEGRFNLALKAFKQAEQVAVSVKSKGAAANRQGKALLDSRHPHESIPHFERAVLYQPSEKVFVNSLGLSYWVLYDSGKGGSADLKRAVDCFYKANSIDPSFHKENLAMALNELKEVDPETAKTYNLKNEEYASDEKSPGAEEGGTKGADNSGQDSK